MVYIYVIEKGKKRHPARGFNSLKKAFSDFLCSFMLIENVKNKNNILPGFFNQFKQTILCVTLYH